MSPPSLAPHFSNICRQPPEDIKMLLHTEKKESKRSGHKIWPDCDLLLRTDKDYIIQVCFMLISLACVKFVFVVGSDQRYSNIHPSFHVHNL